MSDFVVHKGRREPELRERSYNTNIEGIRLRPYDSTLVELEDGRSGPGACLGCGDTPCIIKDESELVLFGILEEFPGDPSRDVCPTKAIEWDETKASAKVNDECIGCGLCAIRCPYGAINLADGLRAEVQTEDPESLLSESPSRGVHPDVEITGQLATLNAPAAKQIPDSIQALTDDRRNLFVRNLLHEVGLNCRTRRKGDTNIRIDAVGFSRGEKPFVAEVEFGSAVLESPRALLEDVAVLHSRYGYDIEQIDPISILLAFPSLRSEYYQVIRDIENVLGLRCRSIAVGALLALLWHLKKIDEFGEDDFTIGAETVNLSAYLRIETEELLEPYPGAFTPAK